MPARFRALVLAAGRGRRLQPLTDQLPKPLLPVLGRPLVAWTLDRLAGAGCEAAALNLHHLGTAISDALGEQWRGLPLSYSAEPQILGTSGALGPLRSFFAGARELVVINGDSLCRWPLRRLLAHHRRHRPAATLLLTRQAAPQSFGGGVGVDRAGRLVSLRPGRAVAEVARRGVFAGVHVLSPELLARLPPGRSDFVADLYEPLIEEGVPIHTVTSRRAWHDLGTPGRYLEAVLARSRTLGVGTPGWRSPAARVQRSARVRRSVLEEGAEVAPRARLDRCLLLPGARVGSGCRLRDVVVAPGTVVPPGSHIEGRLLSTPRTDQALPGGSSRLGELVLTPLERR